MLRKVICMLVSLCIVVSIVTPVFAAKENSYECLVTELVEPRLASSALPDEHLTISSVDIRNIPNASTVMSLVPIIAKSSSTLYKLYYRIDKGTLRAMTKIGKTVYSQAVWNSTASTVGWHIIYVYAKTILGSTVASTHVHVYVGFGIMSFAVYYEIDYMSGHYPPASVLTYWKNYWKTFGISVTLKVDDVVTDPTPGDGKITDADFWKIEKQYNDVWKYDDRAFGSSASGKYTLREKWMLYGTWAPISTTGGYCYVLKSGGDALAGNYIFIADSMIDNWEVTNAIPSEGGEESVALHEAGHSIGIEKLSSSNYEVYDSDYYSVMSSMRLQNAKYIAPHWYYSKEYWVLANLRYYRLYRL